MEFIVSIYPVDGQEMHSVTMFIREARQFKRKLKQQYPQCKVSIIPSNGRLLCQHKK